MDFETLVFIKLVSLNIVHMLNTIVKVQSGWRSYKCRKSVKVFSKLPDDVWKTILEFICKNNEKFSILQRILFKKMILFTWSVPKINLESKLKLIDFISRSPLYFEKKIVEQCLELCKRLLTFITEKIKLFYVNSCVERIVTSRYTL